MTTGELLDFLRTQRLAVQASTSAGQVPQAALIGIAVTDNLEIVFDTLASSRKACNLRRAPAIALVIGGSVDGDARTVQYEGVVDEPTGQELDRIVKVYLSAWPDGVSRQSWPGLIYMRVRPTWVRYSDFTREPPHIVEFAGEDFPAATT